MWTQHSNVEFFSFAVLSTAKEIYSHPLSFAPLSQRAVKNMLAISRTAKLGAPAKQMVQFG
jgi:hypothetical protein